MFSLPKTTRLSPSSFPCQFQGHFRAPYVMGRETMQWSRPRIWISRTPGLCSDALPFLNSVVTNHGRGVGVEETTNVDKEILICNIWYCLFVMYLTNILFTNSETVRQVQSPVPDSPVGKWLENPGAWVRIPDWSNPFSPSLIY